MPSEFGELKIRGIHHIGVVVDDLAAAETFLARTLGLNKVAETEQADLKASFFDCHGTQIEVIEISDPIARSVRLGSEQARIEHIALIVDDLDDAVATLGECSVKTRQPSDGRRTAWTQAETSDGVMYQFVEGSEPDR